MAIPQDRYVKITSTNVGDAAISDRELGGLFLTKGKGWSPVDGVKDASGVALAGRAMEADSLIIVHSTEQAKKYFASNSDEVAAAERYFSYVSPSGTSPETLTFARVKVTDGDGNILTWKKTETDEGWYNGDTEVSSPTIETPKDAFGRVSSATINFGGFAFIDSDYTCEQIKDVAVENHAKNYKHLFSVACTKDAETVAADDVMIGQATAASFATYLGADVNDISGVVITKGDSVLSAQIPMAIGAATNYDGVNSVPTFMFKSIASETATVDDETEADTLDRANVNYVGLVQINGAQRSFYQRGRCANGEDIGVYFNEMWLKSRISSDILDYMLSVERIPANADGELLIYSIAVGAANKALTNGVIEKGKTLDDDQKRKVYSLTGDNEAWMNIENVGYVIDVKISKKESSGYDNGDYIATYQLIYAKGDAIKKVEGTNILL